MGNTSSDVNDSVKAQAGGEGGPAIYGILNLNGGGVLMNLWKDSIVSKNYDEIDKYIINELPQWMYNDGKGENVPIEKRIRRRIGNKPTVNNDKNELTQFTCWQIEKTGAVGESLLHICMLLGHFEIAKRLLKYIPTMINDIYLSEDYYGENALHMAIVAEDPLMVKFLLKNGADVHQGACGKFFCPDDQKQTQQNTLTNETPIFAVATNYVGNAYFGEFPLSFAAILNQKDSVRLLMAYGADPNKQDFNGNTVLHMLVIYDNLPMFEMMLDYNASLDIKNRQNLTPLTLAAKLARKEIFQYILERKRQYWFSYADISCGAYPLDTIDSINPDGTTDVNSAIFILSNEDSEPHLDLLEGFVVDLVYQKWDRYIKRRFYFELILFLTHFALAFACIILKKDFNYYLNNINCTEVFESYTKLTDDCKCVYLYPTDNTQHIRLIFEILMVIYCVVYIILFGMELYVQKLTLFLQTLYYNPSKILFMLSMITVLLIIPLRLACNTYGEDVLVVLSIIFKAAFILYLGRGFRRISTFVYIIHTVIGSNMNKWAIIFIIFIAGFSQGFYAIYDFGKDTDPALDDDSFILFNHPIQSFYNMAIMSIRDVLAPYNNLNALAKNSGVGKILLVVYLIVIAMVLLNILIAMMVKTYNTTTEAEREWLRQWFRQVLTIEKNISIKDRIEQQKKYSYVNEKNQKYFMVRWKQTSEEKEELKDNWRYFKKYLKGNDYSDDDED